MWSDGGAGLVGFEGEATGLFGVLVELLLELFLR